MAVVVGAKAGVTILKPNFRQPAVFPPTIEVGHRWPSEAELYNLQFKLVEVALGVKVVLELKLYWR